MTVPLVVLAFGATAVGAYSSATHGFAHFLAPRRRWPICRPADLAAETPGHLPHGRDEHGHHGWWESRCGRCSIWAPRDRRLGWPGLMNVFGLYSLSYGKFFFDPIYTLCVVWPLLGVARLAAWFDRYVIDGLVDFCGKLPNAGRRLAAGCKTAVQFYALAMMLGLLVVAGSDVDVGRLR